MMFTYHSEDCTEEFDPCETNGGVTLLTYYKALIRRKNEGYIIDDEGIVAFSL